MSEPRLQSGSWSVGPRREPPPPLEVKSCFFRSISMSNSGGKGLVLLHRHLLAQCKLMAEGAGHLLLPSSLLPAAGRPSLGADSSPCHTWSAEAELSPSILVPSACQRSAGALVDPVSQLPFVLPWAQRCSWQLRSAVDFPGGVDGKLDPILQVKTFLRLLNAAGKKPPNASPADPCEQVRRHSQAPKAWFLVQLFVWDCPCRVPCSVPFTSALCVAQRWLRLLSCCWCVLEGPWCRSSPALCD